MDTSDIVVIVLILFFVYNLLCSWKALEVSEFLINRIHDFNQDEINNGNFDLNFERNYKLIPSFAALHWHFFFFGSVNVVVDHVMNGLINSRRK